VPILAISVWSEKVLHIAQPKNALANPPPPPKKKERKEMETIAKKRNNSIRSQFITILKFTVIN
jgi:hypothetical protein